MTLNFEKYNYELFLDWQKNALKDLFTIELEKKTKQEKKDIPKLLSSGDLRQR